MGNQAKGEKAEKKPKKAQGTPAKAPWRPDRRLLDAVIRGPDAVEAAIAAGAGAVAAKAVDNNRRTAFLLAAARRDLRSMELLLPLSDPMARDRMGRDALFLVLLELHGWMGDDPKKIEKNDQEGAAILEKFAPICGGLAQHDLGSSALMMAAKSGLARCVEILAPFSDLGATNRNGQNALMGAASFNHANCLRRLIELGAPDGLDEKGRDALLIAAESGAAECLRLLMADGRDITRTSSLGKDAVELALGVKNEADKNQSIRALLSEWEKRPDGQERANRALRSYASSFEEEDGAAAFKELLAWANVNARGRAQEDHPEGRSALDEVAFNGRGALAVQILLDAGADANDANATAESIAGQTAIEVLAAAVEVKWFDAPGSKTHQRWMATAHALAAASNRENVAAALALALVGGGPGTSVNQECLRKILGQELARKDAEALSREISSHIGALRSAEAQASGLPKAKPGADAGSRGESGESPRRKPLSL